MDDNEEQANDDIISDDYEEVTLSSKTFKVENGRIISIVDGYDAMVQAVDKILKTERFVEPIYSEDYGTDLPELIAKDFNYIATEAPRMIEEALKADERITDINIDNVEKIAPDSILITGSVSTIFGDINIRKEVTN